MRDLVAARIAATLISGEPERQPLRYRLNS
jgi:hypothetical protein